MLVSSGSVRDQPIGVFDSGVGGLTILKALKNKLPNEKFIYFGDTLNLPYGVKSPKVIQAFSLAITQFLVKQGVKFLVIACNTASMMALATIKKNHPSLPVFGVVEPGARAALQVNRKGAVAVLATEGTVSCNGYENYMRTVNSRVKVKSISCGLLVSLVEEGWADKKATELILREYLAPITQYIDEYDTLLLGCTHFPILINQIHEILGGRCIVVSPADAVAHEVSVMLQKNNLQVITKNPSVHYFITDALERFLRVSELGLAMTINPIDVDLIDLNHSER